MLSLYGTDIVVVYIEIYEDDCQTDHIAKGTVFLVYRHRTPTLLLILLKVLKSIK